MCEAWDKITGRNGDKQLLNSYCNQYDNIYDRNMFETFYDAWYESIRQDTANVCFGRTDIKREEEPKDKGLTSCDWLVQEYGYSPTFTYAYTVGQYGSCSESCGGGLRSRSVNCVRSDGQVVADTMCSGSTKPPASQTCNSQPCGKSGNASSIPLAPNIKSSASQPPLALAAILLFAAFHMCTAAHNISYD